MEKRNNVNLSGLKQFMEKGKEDPLKLRKTNKIVGRWNFDERMPQFFSEIEYECGKVVMESDQPSSQGGSGMRPGPMHYCLYGIASCITATFATIASIEGVKLDELGVEVESDLNFSKVLGFSEEPIVEKVSINLFVKTAASEEKVMEIKELAEQRCPGVFCLKTPINLETQIEVKSV